MPVVNGKQYPYTAAGITAANKAKNNPGNPGPKTNIRNQSATLSDLKTGGETINLEAIPALRGNNVQQPGPVIPKPDLGDPTSKVRRAFTIAYLPSLNGQKRFRNWYEDYLEFPWED